MNHWTGCLNSNGAQHPPRPAQHWVSGYWHLVTWFDANQPNEQEEWISSSKSLLASMDHFSKHLRNSIAEVECSETAGNIQNTGVYLVNPLDFGIKWVSRLARSVAGPTLHLGESFSHSKVKLIVCSMCVLTYLWLQYWSHWCILLQVPPPITTAHLTSAWVILLELWALSLIIMVLWWEAATHMWSNRYIFSWSYRLWWVWHLQTWLSSLLGWMLPSCLVWWLYADAVLRKLQPTWLCTPFWAHS